VAAVGTVVAVGRVLRLPAPDRRRAVEAVVELTRASLVLLLLPSSRTGTLLGPLHRAEASRPIEPGQLREARLTGLAVTRAAARLPWHPTCLRQALAVQRMLRRRGIPGQLRLGVTSPTNPSAHAWVTVEGEPVVGGRGLERFVPLAAFD
jgi:hypothetical protein